MMYESRLNKFLFDLTTHTVTLHSMKICEVNPIDKVNW